MSVTRYKTWLSLATLGLMLFLAACGQQATPAPTETPYLAPTPIPATPAVVDTFTPTSIAVPADTPAPTAEATAEPGLAPGSLPSRGFTFQNPQRYRVEYIVLVDNGGFNVDDLRVYQPRPVEWYAQRDVEVEEVSPVPTKEGEDPIFGNGMYYWQMSGEPKRGEGTYFSIQFTFTAYETVTDINPEDVQAYNERDPYYALYTRPERFIEADDPEIVQLANQAAAGETNPYLLARRFYDYVVDNAEYELLGRGLLGAKELLTTGEGECGDYAALFVALCRAKGIPARPVVGYWAISGVEQTHVWAEFYVEPFGWVPVDPTIGQSEPDERDYYFGNMDNGRVILNKGYNISLDPPGPDDYVAPFLQVPLWWFWGSGADADTMSLERTAWTVTSIP